MQSNTSQFLDSFRRITSSGKFIPEIDGLRFVAISSVFFYHLVGDILRHSDPGEVNSFHQSIVFGLSQHGNFGVQLFFVISGFILGLPFASQYLNRTKPVSLRRYFLRRITRLEPPYLVSLILFLILKLVGGRGDFQTLWAHFVASCGYFHNVLYHEPSTINFVAWSLEIEIQFYVLAPLLSLVFLIRLVSVRRLLLCFLSLSVSAIQLVVPDPHFVQLTLIGQLQFFLTGLLLADIYTLHYHPDGLDWRWDAISVLGWPLLAIMLANTFGTLVISPFLVLILYYAAFRGLWTNRLFRNVWITTIGGMCYSIYLLHNYLIALTGFLTEPLGRQLPFEARVVVQFFLITPSVLFFSALYFRLIERPCMKVDWPRALLARFRSSHPVTAADCKTIE